MIKEVLLVFKTHLDIGFTDYAENVAKSYLEDYIPNAIKTAYQQRGTENPFIWTTGSWLIDLALKNDDGTVEKAINDGLIKWHALPFTTHTEYMNTELFKYGLDISKRLDERFGKKTIAAKMSDVPGHTIGIVPLLADAGIELLHIGVNPATPMPEVPEIFTWKCGDKSITVMYNGGGYGTFFEIDDTAVAFCVTGDNLGPHGSDNLKALYEDVRNKYPGAVVMAATLDDVAVRLRGKTFPVIENEIGDSWIHGVGTDPTKTRVYRSVLRQAHDLKDYDLTENLLLVPEHTWGMDLKTHFHDDANWFLSDLQKAPNKLLFEKSWDEQRDYVTKAAQILDVDISDDLKVEKVNVDGMVETEDKPSVRIIYQLFNGSDYERYKKDYMIDHVEWAIWDFTKVGIPDYQSGEFEAKVVGAWSDNRKKIFELSFDSKIREFSGLPQIFVIEEDDMVEIKWFGKKQNRLPEAFWLKFTGMKENWEMLKLDQWIKPKDCIGMKNLHAVWSIRNDEFEIDNLDAPLVAPYGCHLLEWENICDKQDMHFNLYNNIWNTNFPMWFSDDTKFRFRIKNM